MSTRWQIGIPLSWKGEATTYLATKADVGNQGVMELLGWRAAVPVPPVERALSPGWLKGGSWTCWHGWPGRGVFVMSCGTRGPYIGKHDGHGHCPGACEAHAESMGVFASPEPKAEAAKPCADWCGLPQSDKRVPCGLGLSLVTYVKGTVFQHCSDACKDMALGAQLAPVVEKPRPLTCSCGSVELVAMRVVYKSPPRPVCQRCYLEGESHVFGGEEFYRLARLVDPKPRPAAHPGTVPQVFGLGVGVWASRGMAVKR